MGWFRKINKNGEDYKPIGNVITATSLSVSGPGLADGDVVRVMFTTDIAGSDTSTPLALTWNGGATPIPVKASKEGSLASIYAFEYATNLYRYISAYVTLELAYDGTNQQFVVIGNPVILSGRDYTIYADGQMEGCPPVGAVYVQYPNKKSPEEIWFTATWQNISSDYAGAFFRAAGGKAQAFSNQTSAQADMIKTHTTGTESADHYHNPAGSGYFLCFQGSYGETTQGLEQGGMWAGLGKGQGLTGGRSNSHTHTYGNATNNPETRPINFTVQIWERIA